MANTSTTGKATESFGTPSTLNYIRKLHEKWVNAQQQLTKYQTNLDNLQNQKENIGNEFTRIRKAKAEAEKNLKEANTALAKIQTVVNFFRSRLEITQSMVDHAYSMALNIFEATEFVNKKGQERVEEIKTLVNEFNKVEQEDSSQQWSDIFSSSISDAGAQGVAAFTAGTKAVNAAFTAYISNQQINVRTQNYLNQFLNFETQLRNIITRLGRELALINRRFIILLSKNAAVNLQVNEMNAKVQEYEFLVAQYHAEFNAAQQGTEVLYTPANSPAG